MLNLETFEAGRKLFVRAASRTTLSPSSDFRSRGTDVCFFFGCKFLCICVCPRRPYSMSLGYEASPKDGLFARNHNDLTTHVSLHRTWSHYDLISGFGSCSALAISLSGKKLSNKAAVSWLTIQWPLFGKAGSVTNTNELITRSLDSMSQLHGELPWYPRQ